MGNDRNDLVESQKVEPQPETWSVWARVREKVLFRSSRGRLETLPRAIVDLIARGEPLDLDVEERGDTVAFLSAGKVIASIPKSLAVVLDREHLLRGWTG